MTQDKGGQAQDSPVSSGASSLGTGKLSRYLPILDWGRRYNPAALSKDMVAALIVTVMLIPQSLAYALLAGLPPVVGIYASLLPLVLYTLSAKAI